MKKRKFEVTMRVPTGIKYGTLIIEEDNGNITGCLDILRHKNTISGNISADGIICFAGEIATPVRTFAYKACGSISGKALTAEINGEHISCTLTGREVSL